MAETAGECHRRIRQESDPRPGLSEEPADAKLWVPVVAADAPTRSPVKK